MFRKYGESNKSLKQSMTSEGFNSKHNFVGSEDQGRSSRNLVKSSTVGERLYNERLSMKKH